MAHLRGWLALSSLAVATLACGLAAAQVCQPACGTGFVCQAGACVAVATSQPGAPTGALPPVPPSAPTAEPQAPAPSPAPAPAYTPPGYTQPGYTPPGYAQPGYAPPAYTPPGYAPAPGASPPPAPPSNAFSPGLYLGAALGYGAPIGATTWPGSQNASIGGSVGAMIFAGYQLTPNFGIGAFGHYNDVSIQFVKSSNEPDEASAHVLLYGAELRGGLMSESVDAWGSIGIALGNGSLEIKNTEGPYTFSEKDDVTFGAMPTLAFGAEGKLTPAFGIGALFRLYVANVSEACTDQKTEESSTGYSYSQSDCTSDMSGVILPNIAFAGVSATFRP